MENANFVSGNRICSFQVPGCAETAQPCFGPSALARRSGAATLLWRHSGASLTHSGATLEGRRATRLVCILSSRNGGQERGGVRSCPRASHVRGSSGPGRRTCLELSFSGLSRSLLSMTTLPRKESGTGAGGVGGLRRERRGNVRWGGGW
jgi:hypothetical protein